MDTAEQPDSSVDATTVRDQLLARGGASETDSANGNLAGDDIWSGKYSPKAMIGVWIALAVVTVALLSIAISLAGVWWTIFLWATPIMWIGGYGKLLYNQWSVSYTLTTKRFTHEHGLLRRVTDRIEVIDMDDVSVSQGLVERFTGTGTIKIISSDRSHPEFYIRGIDNAVAIGTQMDDARRAERERRGLHIESI